MRVLIIGGTGFIGSYVVREFSAHGHTVAIYHRGKTQAKLPQGVHEIVDPASTFPIQAFPPKLFDFNPDVVVHTLAMGEVDAEAAAHAFAGKIERIVMLSSGDVYRAYGRFTRIEPGPIEEGLLTEDSPLRSVLFPYRKQASSPESLEYWYEKILAEKAILQSKIPATILRLPKVYGSESNADLKTVYAYRHHPSWRWTHGYVGNVAPAVVLAATSSIAGKRIYNVGEAYTPTTAERLACLPPSATEPDSLSTFEFQQNIAYNTSRLRNELEFKEVVPEQEAMLQTLCSKS